MARNIRLKNSQGTNVTYNGVTKVNLLDTDGKEVVFSEQKPTQTKTITPTKSEQVATADAGYELSQVTVNAIPEEYIVPEGALYITENGDYDVSAKESVNVNVEVITAPVEPPVFSIKNITENGTYNASDDNADGYSSVTVNVEIEPNLQEKTATDNGEVVADSGYDGLSKVIVNVEKGITPTGTLEVTTNGEHNVATYEKVNVNVASSGSGERDPNETLYEMKREDYLRQQIGLIGYTDIPTEEEYMEQQIYVNATIKSITGVAF